MPALTQIADYFSMKIGINGPVGGFTETYDFPLGLAGYSSVRTDAAAITTARAKLLAKNHSIVFSTLSLWSRNRDAYPPLTYQTGPELIGAEMDNPETCNNTSGGGLLFRFGTGDGKYINRLLRAVRDSWLNDNLSTLAAFTVYNIGGPYLTYNPPDSAVNLLGNFLALVRDKTVLIVPDDPEAPTIFTPYKFASVGYRRVGQRKMGKRLGQSRGRQASMS